VWLETHQIPFEFHNYKKQGITAAKLKNWSNQLGWQVVLNKKSSTWRALTPEVQATITNEKAAIQLLTENTSGIKRPLIEKGEKVIALGYDADQYAKLFKK
jgi:Spx/MgsR family transcriptional regulator